MNRIDILRHWPAVLVASIGFIASLSAFQYARNTAREGLSAEFSVQAEARARNLQEVLSHYQGTIEGFATAFPYQHLDAAKFRAFARSIVIASPVLGTGLITVSWAPRVDGPERANFEAAVQAEGVDDYKIRELMPDGHLGPAPPKPEYYPLRYVEPEGQHAPLGLDLRRTPDLRQALARGAPAVSSPLHMARGPENSLLYVPVYANPADTGNPALPVGLLTLRLSMGASIGTVIGAFGPSPRGVDVFVLDDAASPGKRLVYAPAATAVGSNGEPIDEAEVLVEPYWGASFSFAGRDYTMILRPTPGLLAEGMAGVGRLELVGGLATTLLVTLYLITSRTSARRLRGLAQTLQREAHIRREVEDQLRTALDEAQIASRAKSQFLANMSHELRTPLNAIIGFSEVISKAMFGPVGERYRDYACDIHGSGHHLLRIINDLLDLSKVEAGRLELYEDPVPLAAIFEACRRMVAERASSSGVMLDFQPTDLEAIADELRLEQIVLNLVSNAVKFTPASGRVRVAATLTAGGNIAISITDTGIGMAAEDIPRALQPFGQIDSVLTRSYSGTGLGLPLAQRLVELHGGTLTIESRLGEGTSATVILPPERTHLRNVATR